jgi:hypothetical protein
LDHSGPNVKTFWKVVNLSRGNQSDVDRCQQIQYTGSVENFQEQRQLSSK